MKLIFLDIDGVLNHEEYYERNNTLKKHIKPYPDSDIDEKSMSNLNSIIEKTDANIVITSNWRIRRSIEELQDLFNYKGFKGKIIDKTPNLRTNNSIFRGNEIHYWLSNNKDKLSIELYKYRHYVILDDDSDMLYWQRNNFILVDRFVGLTPGVAFQAVKILNN